MFAHVVFAIKVSPYGFPWMSQHSYGARELEKKKE